MYNTQRNTSQNTLQSTNSDTNVDGMVAGALATGGLFFIFSLIISFILFILWVWSMVSMIQLNKRFNAFLELYKEAEFEEVSVDNGGKDNDHEMTESEIETARMADIKKQKMLKISIAVTGVLIVVLFYTVWLLG